MTRPTVPALPTPCDDPNLLTLRRGGEGAAPEGGQGETADPWAFSEQVDLLLDDFLMADVPMDNRAQPWQFELGDADFLDADFQREALPCPPGSPSQVFAEDYVPSADFVAADTFPSASAPAPAPIPVPTVADVPAVLDSEAVALVVGMRQWHVENGLAIPPYLAEVSPEESLGSDQEANQAQVSQQPSDPGYLPLCRWAGDDGWQCGTAWSSSEELDKHIKDLHTAVQAKGEDGFRCCWSGCEVKCADRVKLTRHIRTHSLFAPSKCQVCRKELASNDSLKRHTRSCQGWKEFSCDREGCDKAFATKESLKDHLHTHDGKKPYRCGQCGLAMASQSNLSKHKKDKHSTAKFFCTACNKGFVHEKRYLEHLSKAHASQS